MSEFNLSTPAEHYTPQESGHPVWVDAASTMKIDVAINKDDMVWVLHNRPFPDYLEWIEFDRDSKIMTFITAGGKLQDLGVPIHPPMDEKLARADSVFVMLVQEGEVRDMGKLPLIVQQSLGRKKTNRGDKT